MSEAPAPPRQRPARAVDRAAGVLPWLALLAFVAYAVMLALPVGNAARAVAAIAVFQLLPGVLVWRTIRPRDGSWLEDLALGFALGLTIAVPTQVIAGLAQAPLLSFALPLLVVAVVLAVPGLRRRALGARRTPVPWWVNASVAGAAMLCFPQFMAWCRTNPLTISGHPFGSQYVDANLHEAFIGQLLHRGPTSWPTVVNEPFVYHWLSHAWMAHITRVSGGDLAEVSTRIAPALLPVACAAAVAAATLRISRSGLAAAAATWITFVAGGGSAFGLSGRLGPNDPGFGMDASWFPIEPASPTLAPGLPTMLTLLTMLTLGWRKELPKPAYALVPVVAMVSGGSKGSTLPVVIAGLALAALAMAVWNRPMLRRVLLDIVVLVVTLAVTMKVVFGGSAAGLTFDPNRATHQSPLWARLRQDVGTDILVLGGLTAFIGSLARLAFAVVLPASRRWRREPAVWVMVGAPLAAALAITFFAHPGSSQVYFVRTALPLAAMAGGIGVAALAEALPRAGLRLALLAGLLPGIGMYVVPVLVHGGSLTKGQKAGAWPMAATCAVVGLVLLVVAVLVSVVVGRRVAVSGRRRWALAAATVSLGLTAWGATGFVDALRQPLPEQNRPEPAGTIKAVSQSQIAGARYIRDHSGVNDLFMSNRHCREPRAYNPKLYCDARRWLVTAYSERQALVEAWSPAPTATERYGLDSISAPYWDMDLLRLNDTFYTAPSAQAQRQLWDKGVRWVYVDMAVPHAATLAPYATLEYVGKDAAVYRLNRPS